MMKLFLNFLEEKKKRSSTSFFVHLSVMAHSCCCCYIFFLSSSGKTSGSLTFSSPSPNRFHRNRLGLGDEKVKHPYRRLWKVSMMSLRLFQRHVWPRLKPIFKVVSFQEIKQFQTCLWDFFKDISENISEPHSKHPYRRLWKVSMMSLRLFQRQVWPRLKTFC